MTRPASGLVALPILIAAMTMPAAAQHGGRPAYLPVDSLAWIAGHWVAADDVATHEAVWMEPSGGVMTGLVRVRNGDQVVGHELFLIEQSGAGPVLSRRTYGSSLAPGKSDDQWTRLRLREVSGSRARFSSSTPTSPLTVTLERIPGGRLRISVERLHDGARVTESLEFTRQHQ
jgi:hypothetical protein